MKLFTLSAAALLPLSLFAAPAFAQSASGVVISQFAVRGPAGGNDEFVELYNASGAPVNIGGWLLQGCAAGTPGNASTRATIPAGYTIPAGGYYLFANPTSPGYSLGVTPDQTYATGFTDFLNSNFSGIQLVNAAAVRQDGVGSTQSPCREGTGIVTPSATGLTAYAFLRTSVNGVVQDTNNNAGDFPGPAAAGQPRNSATPPNGGGGGGLPTVTLAVAPAAFTEAGGSATVTATLSAAYTAQVTINLGYSGTATNGTDYTASASSITIAAGATSGSITLSAIDDTVYEGDETVIATITSASGATAGSPNAVTATITDNDPQPPPVLGTRIYTIEGAAHRSPLVGQTVTNVPGIVTAIINTGTGRGFYMQDGDGDGNPSTSDGIFVFFGSTPVPATVVVGGEVTVSGTVAEFRVSGIATNLTTTEIDTPTVTAAYPVGAGNLFTTNFVTPVILGNGGRQPPTDIIDNDSRGNIETSTTTVFDPSEDGIDFYESLESMLVSINNPVVVGPIVSTGGATNIWVLGDNGVNATGRTARGGIALVERSTGVDSNPEHIQLRTGLAGGNPPNNTAFNVGDSLSNVSGIVSYFGGAYQVLTTTLPQITTPGNLPPGDTAGVAKGGDRLSVAAYNIENYDPNDPVARRNQLAQHIVNVLGSPDIISLGEVQDNNGAVNDSVVDASTTIQTLIDAIVAAGGPTYSYDQINPVDDQDGGEPGGNIRVVQLYNPLRVSFVPGTNGAGDSLTPTAVSLVNGKLVLSLSPGRVDPQNEAWSGNGGGGSYSGSRKPLAATYDFNGRRVIVVSNHWNSKGGDDGLFGVNQPPVLASEPQRRAQAQVVHDFVYGALALDPNARMVVLGDFNDFDYSNPFRILRDGALGPNGEEGTQTVLVNLGTALVPNPAERYSYVFAGNSQELDHILVTTALFSRAAPQYQVGHVNSEYANQTSDHDPLIASFLLPANAAPTAVAVATPPTVTAGNTVSLDGSGSTDSDGTIASYAWSQTSGPAVTIVDAGTVTASFVAPSVSSAQTLGFLLTVTDNDGATDTATVTVSVTPANRPPVAVDDTLSLNQDRSATVDVLANDSDPDNDPLSIDTVGTPAFGTTAIEGALIRYTPNAGYAGSDSFTYTIRDGRGGSATATVTVTVYDTVPDAFAFTAVSNAERSTLVTSNTVTVSGITAATSISVVNGSYRVNGGSATQSSGTVVAGDTVSVQLTSSANFSASTTATLTIGGVAADFKVSTRNANTLPTPFSFAPVTNAPRNTAVISQSIVVTGIEGPASISISGGLFSINNGPFTSFVGAVVNNGDSVRVSQVSSPDFSTTTVATLTIDAFSAGFAVTTEAADTTPDAFSFAPKTGVLRNSVQTSNAITVSGINTPAPISVSGGSYSINGGPFVSTAGTVANGASVVLRQTASRRFNTTTTTTLSIGGVNGTFSVTTRKIVQRANGSNAEADEDLRGDREDRVPPSR